MKLFRLPLVTVAAAACAGQPSPSLRQALDSRETEAVETAVKRAAAELDCPAAQGQMLARGVSQPIEQAPWTGGIQRLEYMVGVSGCGWQTTYVTVCPIGGGCSAAPGRRER